MKKYHEINKEKFKDMLLNHRMTRLDFCKKMGFSPTTLSKKLNGYCRWNLDEILKIRKFVSNKELSDVFFD